MVVVRLAVGLLALTDVTAACKSDLGCSLNGVCSDDGVCACDKPWQGDSCGILGYAVTPVAGKSLYPVNDTRNTWNGPIVHVNGKFHMYNPLYKEGSLNVVITTMHGVAEQIYGPYNWDLPTVDTGGKYNPGMLVFPDDDNEQVYSLWPYNHEVMVARSPNGPFTTMSGSFKGKNSAPVYHQGAFYVTTQNTREIQTAVAVTGPWTLFANITLGVPGGKGTPNGVLEDPFMWVDKRGSWHIVNHAYDVLQKESCGSSTVSAHIFSLDGKDWHILEPKVEPYGHTVHYEDGTSHTYTTLERPFLYFDDEGQLTHLSLSADLVTGDEGCSPLACTNCKWHDHAGTILIQLDTSTGDATKFV